MPQKKLQQISISWDESQHKEGEEHQQYRGVQKGLAGLRAPCLLVRQVVGQWWKVILTLQ